MREVPLHGLDRHHELLGDLPVGQAVGGHPGDPALGRGQRGHRLGLDLARLLAEPVEEAAYPPLQRPQLLAAGVLLGRAQQRQRALLGVGCVGQEQQPGEVGVDLRGEPVGAVAAQHGAGAQQVLDAVRAGVDGDGAGCAGRRPGRTASRRPGRCRPARAPASAAVRASPAAQVREGRAAAPRQPVGGRVGREGAGPGEVVHRRARRRPSAAESSPRPGGPARQAERVDSPSICRYGARSSPSPIASASSPRASRHSTRVVSSVAEVGVAERLAVLDVRNGSARRRPMSRP